MHSHTGSLGNSRVRSRKNDDVHGTLTRMLVLAVHNAEARKIVSSGCSARKEACYVELKCPPKLVHDPSETRQPVKDSCRSKYNTPTDLDASLLKWFPLPCSKSLDYFRRSVYSWSGWTGAWGWLYHLQPYGKNTNNLFSLNQSNNRATILPRTARYSPIISREHKSIWPPPPRTWDGTWPPTIQLWAQLS